MNSKKVPLIVLGVAVVGLVAMVLRSTSQGPSASDEAARLVRSSDLDEDSLIEDTPTAQRERPAGGAAQTAKRLESAEATTDEAGSDSTADQKAKRKTENNRQRKRTGRREVAADSDRDDERAAKTKGPEVKHPGKQIRKGGG